jgi:hypothetical protein
MKEDELGGASGTHGGYQNAYRVSVKKSGQPKHNVRTRLENTAYRYRVEGVDCFLGAQDKEN